MSEFNADIGLHVGSTHVFVARQIGNSSVKIDVQPTLMTLVPTETINTEQLDSQFTRYEGKTLFVGDEARLPGSSRTTEVDLRSCAPSEIHKPEAEYALFSLLKRMLGAAISPAKLCVHSTPSPSIDKSDHHLFYVNILRDLIKRLGYLPLPIAESRATLVEEMLETDTHLLAFSCSDTNLNGCLGYRGMITDDFSLELGWNKVDKDVAKALDIDLQSARNIRYRCSSMAVPNGREEEVVLHFSQKLIVDSLRSIGTYIRQKGVPIFDNPIDVVWSGTWAVPDDFSLFLLRHAKQQDFPIPIGEVRIAINPATVVARGCLKISRGVKQQHDKEPLLVLR